MSVCVMGNIGQSDLTDTLLASGLWDCELFGDTFLITGVDKTALISAALEG
jgi:hypothetical protein